MKTTLVFSGIFLSIIAGGLAAHFGGLGGLAALVTGQLGVILSIQSNFINN